jgi:hypothetical protein
MISKEKLEEFKKIYKKRFGENLSNHVALEKATKLLKLVEVVRQPMTQEEYNKAQKSRKETKQ